MWAGDCGDWGGSWEGRGVNGAEWREGEGEARELDREMVKGGGGGLR